MSFSCPTPHSPAILAADSLTSSGTTKSPLKPLKVTTNGRFLHDFCDVEGPRAGLTALAVHPSPDGTGAAIRPRHLQTGVPNGLMTWHIHSEMDESTPFGGLEARITPRLIDALYTEAMLLADEARAYFDEAGRDERLTLEPFARVGFACESLKVTTRIMHIVAWLLTQRAVETGEIKAADGRRPERRLGNATESDPLVVEQLPPAAQRLVMASSDLYARIRRLDEGQLNDEPAVSPARVLMGRLERDLIWNRGA